jgi:hypothetical protein
MGKRLLGGDKSNSNTPALVREIRTRFFAISFFFSNWRENQMNSTKTNGHLIKDSHKILHTHPSHFLSTLTDFPSPPRTKSTKLKICRPPPKKYSSIVFPAYVVPTIPSLEEAVGDPDGAVLVSGKYAGVEGDPKDDIDAGFKLVAAAASQAYDLATKTLDDDTVQQVFVVPEFFFRGPEGAYERTNKGYALLDELRRLVRELANQPKLAHWMCVWMLEACTAG